MQTAGEGRAISLKNCNFQSLSFDFRFLWKLCLEGIMLSSETQKVLESQSYKLHWPSSFTSRCIPIAQETIVFRTKTKGQWQRSVELLGEKPLADCRRIDSHTKPPKKEKAFTTCQKGKKRERLNQQDITHEKKQLIKLYWTQSAIPLVHISKERSSNLHGIWRKYSVNSRKWPPTFVCIPEPTIPETENSQRQSSIQSKKPSEKRKKAKSTHQSLKR